MVETGLNGFLTLLSSFVEELELAYLGSIQAESAKGSEDNFDVYGVTALRDN